MAKLSAFEKWWFDSIPHRLYIRRFVPRFLRACPEPFRGEVLEVGSGSGWSSRQILETFPQVELTASDVNLKAEKSFKKLRQKYGQRMIFKQADLMKLPFDRETFDIVIALNVLHYASDIRLAIRQFIRVLRPGGLIGLSDVNPKIMKEPRKLLFSSSSMPTRKILQKIMEEEGCEVLKKQGDINYFIWARKPHPIKPATDRELY